MTENVRKNRGRTHGAAVLVHSAQEFQGDAELLRYIRCSDALAVGMVARLSHITHGRTLHTEAEGVASPK